MVARMTQNRNIVKVDTDISKPRRFIFLLLDDFTMLSFAGAVEPLRLANQASGRTLYKWILVGEDGVSVTCSNGSSFAVDMGLAETSIPCASSRCGKRPGGSL